MKLPVQAIYTRDGEKKEVIYADVPEKKVAEVFGNLWEETHR